MSLLRDEKEPYGRDQSPGPCTALTRVSGQRQTEQNTEGQGCAVSVWSALHSLWGVCGPAQESPQVGPQWEKSRISHFPPVYIPVHPRPWCNLEKGQGSSSKSSRLSSQLLGWVEWKNRFLKVTWVIWEKSPGIPKTCCWARGLFSWQVFQSNFLLGAWICPRTRNSVLLTAHSFGALRVRKGFLC